MRERSAASSDDYSVGFLSRDSLSQEQRAAVRFSKSVSSVDVVPLTASDDRTEFEQFDLLWWHRDEPIEPDTLPAAAADRLAAFIDDGGAVLLTLFALEAVDQLDIDARPPDSITETVVPEHSWSQAPAGFLIRSRFAGDTLFDWTETLRLHTQPSRSESAPRVVYDRRIPKHGEVLASAIVGEEDRPNENAIIGWQPGEGRVLGIGEHLVFANVTDEYATTVEALLSNCFQYLTGSGGRTYGGRPKTGEELATMRRELAADAHRPSYHFAPPANWMNDPNGLVHWNGSYHLFYQYNPAGPYHGSIHWGHAVSDDLFSWEDRPVALEPHVDGPDEDGCWSGCTVDDDGTPTFIYTGGNGGDQLPCLARAGDDELNAWEKHEGNPVIDAPPSDLAILSNDDWNAEFRDHDVWRANGTWYHLIGSGIEDEGGAALLFASETLDEWEYVGPALVGEESSDGGMWECPDILDFDDTQILQVSNYDKVVYFTGTFDATTFSREDEGVHDHGNFYAAQSIPNDETSYLSWGWIRPDRTLEAQWDAGWSGVMSIPRKLSTGRDGRLRVEPTEAIADLRTSLRSTETAVLTPTSDDPIGDVAGDSLEIQLDVELVDAESVELSVLEAPDGEERTTIRITEEEVVLDRSESSDSASANTNPQSVSPLPPSPTDGVSLDVFVDASVLEIFINERTALSSRVYPTRSDSTGVSLTAADGTAEVTQLDVWELESRSSVPVERENASRVEAAHE